MRWTDPYSLPQEVLNSAKSVLDKTAGADITVYSNYFRAWAAHFKVSREQLRH